MTVRELIEILSKADGLDDEVVVGIGGETIPIGRASKHGAQIVLKTRKADAGMRQWRVHLAWPSHTLDAEKVINTEHAMTMLVMARTEDGVREYAQRREPGYTIRRIEEI